MNNVSLIDGPINLFRLEGTFGNIKKVLYAFADFHTNVNLQTKCNSFNSIPFANYVYLMLHELSKQHQSTIYDFFIEMYESHIYNPINSKYNGRYIDNFTAMAGSIAHKQKEDKSFFQNARFHYVDNRCYLFNDIGFIVTNLYNMQYDFGIYNQLQRIIESLDDLNMIFNVHKSLILMTCNDEITDLLLDKLTNIEKINIDGTETFTAAEIKTIKNAYSDSSIIEYVDIIVKNNYTQTAQFVAKSIKFFKKMRTRFNNTQVNDFITTKLIPTFIQGIDELKNIINNISKIITDFKKHQERENKYYVNDNFSNDLYIQHNDNLHNLKKEIKSLYDHSITVYTLLVDMYLIKRFLDKSYIEHCILYTGAFHTIRVIYCLLRYFNFKITHCSNKPLNKSIAEINKRISNLKSFSDRDIYTELYPDGPLVQCVDISSFPKNFM